MLSNMGQDDWVPRRFTNLSSRLVKQNGVIFFGLFAIAIIILTQGNVKFLVVFYSINVFITFTLSLLGLVVYWCTHRSKEKVAATDATFITARWCAQSCSDVIGKQFDSGGWEALLTTVVMVTLFYSNAI